MLSWIQTNIGTIVVAALLLVLVVLIIRSLVLDRRAGKCPSGGSCSSCGSRCAGCPMQGKCHGK